MKIILRYGLGIWIAAVIVAAFYWVKPATGFGLPESVGNVSRIVIFHVPAAMVMVLWFAAGAFFAFKYLTHRRPEDDRKSVTALELGMLFGVLATVTGSIFAYQAWNSAWNWDPRETSVLAQLLIYIAYFALRSGISDREQRGRVSGAYALFALATVPFLIFILPRIPAFSSIHPVGTLTNRGGLDIPYKVTLYSALVGYIWLGIRIFRTQVAAGNIEAKLEEIDGLENSSSATVAPRVVRRVPLSSENGTKN